VSKSPYGSAFVAAARKLDGIGSNLNLPARRKRRIHKAQGLHRPEADNLVGIYAALADIDRASVLKQFGNAQFSTFKAALTDLAVSKLGPIGAEMKRLLADPAAIDAVLADGAARAEKMARETMNAVKDVVGFVRS
jgi:tryptophanyl-tRNA synthetase